MVDVEEVANWSSDHLSLSPVASAFDRGYRYRSHYPTCCTTSSTSRVPKAFVTTDAPTLAGCFKVVRLVNYCVTRNVSAEHQHAVKAKITGWNGSAVRVLARAASDISRRPGFLDIGGVGESDSGSD